MSTHRHPICFVDLKQYAEWAKVAKAAREECSPCTDCTPRYRAEMKKSFRCKPADVKINFMVKGRSVEIENVNAFASD